MAGILSWATSIRATMVNDPCRQSLDDQIQTHGFLFLDDYLDNILAQAKRDPIIDLVKTPGRKKDANTSRKNTTPNIMSVPAKEAPTQFPSLPAPSPLRRSTRVQREPSFGMGMGPVPPLPTGANATVGAGKRTSWLMKAREVKAMEVPGKRVSALGPATVAAPVPGMPGGSKRKSGEMLATAVPGMAGMIALAEDGRKNKIAKTSEGDVAVSKEKLKDIVEGKEPAPQQLPAPMQLEPAQIAFPTRGPEESTISMPIDVPQEGMMDRLKRTVEGLGARAGKSMNKSLGGPAAAAALAEAKAAKVAAEARIAERDGRSALPSPAQDVMVGVEQTGSVAAATSKDERPASPPKARERTLSVSDLVSVYEDSGKGKSKEKSKEVEKGFNPASALNKNHVGDDSTSTTPPNSPPSIRTSNSSFVLPSGPVFNKPPVFVPPAPAVPPKDFLFNPPSTAFSLPPASSLGLPARLPSPSSQKSASALSAQSTAWVGQATKLVSSVLGGSKGKKPQVPSLQRAAAAAKKEQEEKDKKTARMKEMENRRQLAIQRKTEEEKSRAMEEEKKIKEEGERRKREREDKEKKDVPTTTVKLAETKTIKASGPSTTSSLKGKGKAKTQDDGLSQPARHLQTQMAARAKAQIQAAKQQQAESENIELPDINSEYSDSDDEDRPRTFDPPDWAQSPELRQQLHMQSTVNPDDIFGPIRPLKMEEVFRTRQSRFRARTSSANWTGNDRLTVEEENEYARRMGFR